MYRLVKSKKEFDEQIEDRNSHNSHYSTDDKLIDVLSDDSDYEERSCGRISVIIKDNFNVNDLLGDQKDDDLYNDEWNAFEEVLNADQKKYYDIDPKNRSTKGVVSQVVSDNEIIIDGKWIPFDRCIITDLSVGDLVNVETTEDEGVVVKPYRYKIFTGKITRYERHYLQYIFCGQSFMRKTTTTDHLKEGDVLKCIVIKNQNSNHFCWRAYPYTQIFYPNTNTEDYTNDLLSNKNGIEILQNIDFGNIKLNSTKIGFVFIKNNGSQSQTLLSVDNEEEENQISFKAFHRQYGKPIDSPFVIRPKSEAFVELLCESKYCGEHKELLVFKFKGFKIGRFLSVTVMDLSGDKWFDNTEYRSRYYADDVRIIPGEKPWKHNKHICQKLGEYLVPERLWPTLQNNWPIEEVFPELSLPLTKDNYRNRFHAMLYLEECETQRNLSRYNMVDVLLRRDGPFFAITVPGLSEGRPSLIIGDQVIVMAKHELVGNQGFIHQIKRDEILVPFNEDFQIQFTGGLFRVIFQINR